jgi:hypothetical protein
MPERKLRASFKAHFRLRALSCVVRAPLRRACAPPLRGLANRDQTRQESDARWFPLCCSLGPLQLCLGHCYVLFSYAWFLLRLRLVRSRNLSAQLSNPATHACSTLTAVRCRPAHFCRCSFVGTLRIGELTCLQAGVTATSTVTMV